MAWTRERDGHGRDHIGAGVAPLAVGGDREHFVGTTVAVTDLRDHLAELDRAALRLDELVAPLPHHARTVAGILELLDEARDLGLVALWGERVPDRGAQVEVLDPLGGPVGLDLVGRHAPHLLRVGLEEGAVEAPPEAGGDEPFEGRLVLRRPDPSPCVGQDAEHRLDDTEVAKRVEGAQRVVVELAVVVDAAHAGAHEEVLVGEDLVPEVSHRLHLREEAMSADVETPAVAGRGSADPAYDVVGFEHRGGASVPAEPVGRGESSRSRADHDGPCRRCRGLVVAHPTAPSQGRLEHTPPTWVTPHGDPE